jgi:hypothetical protein
LGGRQGTFGLLEPSEVVTVRMCVVRMCKEHETPQWLKIQGEGRSWRGDYAWLSRSV